ncbi:hypothetical protein ARSEF1564_008281 [Beauveria bassiana]
MGSKTGSEPAITALDNLGSNSDSANTSEASAKDRLYGNVFVNGGSAQHYEPIPEYEGRHRYDPKAEWTPKEEKRLVRKLDYRICSWVCLMFFALQLDRGNISNALADNFLKDLHLTTNDYNLGMTIFYLGFLFAELPSQMISKKLGPDVWVPAQMILWSTVAMLQCVIRGRTGFFITRGFLGAFEGGFIPDAILYLSYFYDSKELPIRVSYFYTASNLTPILSAFLAYGILHMRGIGGWEGWRWLFVLEGGLTALIGVVSWFYLPPSPTQTAGWLRGKDGWFDEREEIIMVNRILRDDPSKGGMHNRQGLSIPLLWQALSDFDLWPIYLLGFTILEPVAPIQNYLTLTLRQLGFDTFQTNLLTIPGYVLFAIQLIFWTRISEWINNRFLVVLFSSVWLFPLVLSLRLLPDNAGSWERYALTVLVIGFPYVHSIIVSLTSRNAGSVAGRTVGSAVYNMCVQAGSIIASNIYREDDKPHYRRGNSAILGIIAWNAVFTLSIKGYYMWRNKTKTTKWDRMTPDEKRDYVDTTTEKGSKRLDFRFAH